MSASGVHVVEFGTYQQPTVSSSKFQCCASVRVTHAVFCLTGPFLELIQVRLLQVTPVVGSRFLGFAVAELFPAGCSS